MIFLLLTTLSLSLTCTKAATVCYGRYGCFSDDPPFDRFLVPLPSPPDSVGTMFRLYTRNTTLRHGEILDAANNISSVSDSTFHPLRKVKFIVHGYTQNGLSPWAINMRLQLLKREPINVIVVDWGLGSSLDNTYDTAAGNTRLVGAQVADVIRVLCSKFHVRSKMFHIIGHSLGAHAAGFAGEIMAKQGIAIARITGLDPARPGFDIDDAAARLDPTDAMFVDVIHSDVSNGLLVNSLGLQRPCGHVDFYPNGGSQQPGCDAIDVIGDALRSFQAHGQVSYSSIVACNHMKSVAYFAASINSPCVMKAFPCDNWQDFQDGTCLSCNGTCPQMGYTADQYRGKKPVKAFLETVKRQPYCGKRYYKLTVYSMARHYSGWLSCSLLGNKIGITLTGSKGIIKMDKVRDLKHEKTIFILSSAHNIGKLQSVQVHIKGPALFLNNLVVCSEDKNRRYTAKFKESIGGGFLQCFQISSYTRKLVQDTKPC